MPQTSFCRLCTKTYEDFKRLYDDNGQGNDLYEMTFKYFHPTFLNMDEFKHLTAMCLQCWRQIDDFQKFQISVSKAQLLLANDTKLQATKAVEAIPNELQNLTQALLNEEIDYTVIKYEEEFISEVLGTKVADIPVEISKSQDTIDFVEDSKETTITSSSCADYDDYVIKTATAVPSKRNIFLNTCNNYENIDLSIVKIEPEVIVESKTVAVRSKRVSKMKIDSNSDQDIDYEFRTDEDNDCMPSPAATDYSSEDEIPLAKRAATAEVKIFQNKLAVGKDKKEIKAAGTKRKNGAAVQKIKREIKAACTKRKNGATGTKRKNQAAAIAAESEDDEAEVDEAEDSPKTLYPNRINEAELDERLAKIMPTIKCVICSETYSKYTLYREHFRRQHPEDSFFFMCCQRKLDLQYRIAEHIRLHEEPNAFTCEICKTCYSEKVNLRWHMKTIHPETFGTFMKCKLCEKSFPTEKGLKSHFTRKHTIIKKPDRVEQPDGRIIFSCPDCEYISHSYSCAKTHMWYIHRLEATIECDMCDRKFKTQTEFKKHHLLHIKNPIGEFECQFCGKNFKRLHRLNQHQRKAHAAEVPAEVKAAKSRKLKKLKTAAARQKAKFMFTCQYCSRQFLQFHTLRQHKWKNHADKMGSLTKLVITETQLPSKDVSVVSSTTKKAMPVKPIDIMRHVRTQKRQLVYEFACSLCSTQYKRMFDLSKHQRREHPDFAEHSKTFIRKPIYVYCCPLCPIKFKRVPLLIRHYHIKHVQKSVKITTEDSTESNAVEEQDTATTSSIAANSPTATETVPAADPVQTKITKSSANEDLAIMPKAKTQAHLDSAIVTTNSSPIQQEIDTPTTTKENVCSNSSIMSQTDTDDSEWSVPLNFFRSKKKPTSTTRGIKTYLVNRIKADQRTKARQRVQELDELVAKYMPDIICVACQDSFKKLTQLREHFLEKHENEKFFINCCERKFTNSYFIEEHFRVHDDPDVFKCKFCGACYSLKRSLKAHIFKDHPETQLRFDCPKCDRDFPSKHGLTRHNNEAHSEQRPTQEQLYKAKRYICNACNRFFHNEASIRRHQLYECLKPKYECPSCAREYKIYSEAKACTCGGTAKGAGETKINQ